MFRVRALAALAATVCALSVGTSVWAQGSKPKPASSPAMGGKMTSGKTPMRDPKTGRFVKGSGGMMSGGKMSGKKGGMMTGKSGKKTPMRDPKTGRFMKASPAPKTP